LRANNDIRKQVVTLSIENPVLALHVCNPEHYQLNRHACDSVARNHYENTRPFSRSEEFNQPFSVLRKLLVKIVL
jgi:hypothetical protein